MGTWTDGNPSVNDPLSQSPRGIETLAELEGLQNFVQSSWAPDAPILPQGEARLARVHDPRFLADDALLGDSSVVEITMVEGNHMYILNPYRGLIIVDISVPQDPRVVGNAHIMGNPAGLFLSDGRAYVVVSMNFNFWYHLSNQDLYGEGHWEPEYRIGSRLVIIDIEDASRPRIISEYSIEGVAIDSIMVGEAIYIVSSCDSWYNTYSETYMTDETKVLGLSISDPDRAELVDTAKVRGRTNNIHSKAGLLYVSTTIRERNGIRTDVTLLGISTTSGYIDEYDTFNIDGLVESKDQMDHYEGTFRIVSTSMNRLSSMVSTFDVTNPHSISFTGSMTIDDNGRLMATRFAGLMAYTIHLPGSTSINRRIPGDGFSRSPDPLDVIDLKDPSNPVLCDVFEMPGYVTHLEVIGDRIIALGVDDSEDANNVALSLFDVSNPYEVHMMDRVRLGGGSSLSYSNMNPMTMTISLERGLVLLPITSFSWRTDPNQEDQSGVHIVSFDLDFGMFTPLGWYNQPDEVLRTTFVGDHIMSTSAMFLQIVDTADPTDPRVEALIELCPEVLDYRLIGDTLVEVQRENLDGRVAFKVFGPGSTDLSRPVSDVTLTGQEVKWFWSGTHLYSLGIEHVASGTWRAHLTVVNPSNPKEPLVSSSQVDIEGTYFVGGGVDQAQVSWPSWFSGPTTSYFSNGQLGNPVLVDDSFIIFYALRYLYIFNIGAIEDPPLLSTIPVDCSEFYGILQASDIQYLVASVERDPSEVPNSRGGTYDFGLYPIDLYEPGQPRIGDRIAIPGVPIGASESSGLIFTQANWLTLSGRTYDHTLNSVVIENGKATIVAYLEVGYQRFSIYGDRVVVISYQDPLIMSELNVRTFSFTYIEIYDPINFELLGSVKLSGFYSLVNMGEDFVILSEVNHVGTTLLSLSDDLRSVRVSSYNVNPDHYSAKPGEASIVLVQGIYGVKKLIIDEW
jgi:hypothetical protein